MVWQQNGTQISTNNIVRGMVHARRKYAFNPLKIRFPLLPFPHVSFTVSYSNQNTNPLPRRTSSAIGMIGTPPLFPDLTVSGWSSCGTPTRFSPMHPVASCRRSRRRRYCFSFFLQSNHVSIYADSVEKPRTTEAGPRLQPPKHHDDGTDRLASEQSEANRTPLIHRRRARHRLRPLL
jgi:hypothetical protein